MAIYGSDATVGSVRVPIVGGTTAGTPFTVPKGAYALTIIVPSTAATFSIQTLTPNDDQTSETWTTVSSATGVTLTPLTAIVVTGAAITWNIAQIGGGVLRFLASADISGSPITVKVIFHLLK